MVFNFRTKDAPTNVVRWPHLEIAVWTYLHCSISMGPASSLCFTKPIFLLSTLLATQVTATPPIPNLIFLPFHFSKKSAIPGLSFLYFRLFNTVDINKCMINVLPMTAFEPRISGVGGDCSTNWATPLPPFLLFDSIYFYSLHLVHID